MENFRCIAEGETHPDWQYVEGPIVPRDPPAVPEATGSPAGVADIHPEPTLIEHGYKNFNIIAFDGRFYGLGQEEGAFDIQKVRDGQYQSCVEGASANEVKRLIDHAAGSSDT